jgi:hypothetical protein
VSRKDNFVLCRTGLLKLRLRAQRVGSWLRTLNRIDRVLVNLTIRVADRVHSPALAKAIFSVVNKLEGVSENNLAFSCIMREIGLRLARRLSSLAQKWGNTRARDWAFDISFADFLAIMNLNKSGVIDR